MQSDEHEAGEGAEDRSDDYTIGKMKANRKEGAELRRAIVLVGRAETS